MTPPCSLGLSPLGGEFGAALPVGFGLVDHAAHALDLPALPSGSAFLIAAHFFMVCCRFIIAAS